LVGRLLFEELAGIPTTVDYSAEFRYRNPVLPPNTLVIPISQSGETADTLAALEEAKRRGAAVLGVCNVVGSTIARECGRGIYLHAGPEIGVASTKAFTCQITALAMLALMLGRHRNLSARQADVYLNALATLPEQIEQILEDRDLVREQAISLAEHSNFLYIGRGPQYPVGLEGALKLKEISYRHAEGIPAAELKHGPIALVDEKMPVVVLAPEGRVLKKMISNIQEIKARKGRLLGIVTRDSRSVEDGLLDWRLEVPSAPELIEPILTVIPLQILAHDLARHLGRDVDRPRNLAKSVTVE
jgi:glucosamine--fructose-6-phosphate aminotransferase (isomerizing)